MTDVFISYSRKDAEVARELASRLEALDFDVWWDHLLVGGANFRQTILERLKLAKAAIVVWSPDSVLSPWVLDEAALAQRLGKLIPVRLASLQPHDLPLGFGSTHTGLASDFGVVTNGLAGLGVAPSKPRRVPEVLASIEPVRLSGTDLEAAQASDWKRIKDSSDPRDFRAHLIKFPDSDFLAVVNHRLEALEQSAWQSTSAKAEPEAIRSFIDIYKGGRYEGEARRLLTNLEDRAWDKTSKSDSESLAAFLRAFPSGHYSSEARDLIGRLREEEAEAEAWKLASTDPTREKLEVFLKQFPIGRHYREARDLHETLLKTGKREQRWNEIKGNPSVEQLKRFIEDYKGGPEVEEARRQLAERLRAREAKEWAAIKDQLTPAPFLKFLRDYPDGALKKQATDALRGLPDKVTGLAWAEVKDAQRIDLVRLFLQLSPSGRYADEANRALAKLGETPPKDTTLRGQGRPVDLTGTVSPWRKWGVLVPVVVLWLIVMFASYMAVLSASGFRRIDVGGWSIVAAISVTLAALIQFAGAFTGFSFVDRGDAYARGRAHAAGGISILCWIAGLLLSGNLVFRVSSGSSYTTNSFYVNESTPLAAVLIASAVLLFILTFGLRRHWKSAYWLYILACVGGAGLGAVAFVGFCLNQNCFPPFNAYLGTSVVGAGGLAVALYFGSMLLVEGIAGIAKSIQAGNNSLGYASILIYCALVLVTLIASGIWYYQARLYGLTHDYSQNWLLAAAGAATATAMWHSWIGFGLPWRAAGTFDFAERTGSFAAAAALFLVWGGGLDAIATGAKFYGIYLSNDLLSEVLLVSGMAAICVIGAQFIPDLMPSIRLGLIVGLLAVGGAIALVVFQEPCAAFLCRQADRPIDMAAPGLAVLTAFWALSSLLLRDR